MDSWVGKIPRRREWLPTPVFWNGEFHGQKSLGGYSPWCHRVRQLTNFHFTQSFHFMAKSSMHIVRYPFSSLATRWTLHSRISNFLIFKETSDMIQLHLEKKKNFKFE